jgi:TetR/AcrR family transcriptional repressor of nem operon
MSRGEAAKNRKRVVQTASKLFREDGYDGIGISSLMKAAGLTNGAFYKQFDSKEALIAEATTYGLQENEATWREVLDGAGGDPLQAITDWYLSRLHLDHRGEGCTYAALANEAPRREAAVQQAFDRAITTTIGLLAEAIADREDNETQAIQHLSRLVGALTLARAVAGDDLREKILAANRRPDAVGASK